ncbi:helix-turn-helix domain-containing protein, partial [Rhizobium ruizarguesonis]
TKTLSARSESKRSRRALDERAFSLSKPFPAGDDHQFLAVQHIADTLGLSIVNTNKTLKKLSERGLIRWQERGCEVLNG